MRRLLSIKFGEKGLIHKLKYTNVLQQRNLTWTHLPGARWSGVEDLCLHVRRQVGVDGKYQQLSYLRSQPPASLLEQLATRFDLLLPNTRGGEEVKEPRNNQRGLIKEE